jgi:hypothetical protein
MAASTASMSSSSVLAMPTVCAVLPRIGLQLYWIPANSAQYVVGHAAGLAIGCVSCLLKALKAKLTFDALVIPDAATAGIVGDALRSASRTTERMIVDAGGGLRGDWIRRGRIRSGRGGRIGRGAAPFPQPSLATLHPC